MSDLLVSLDTVRQSDVQQVGAKAAALGTLLDAGFPVPPGFCVTAEAFRLAFDALIDPISSVLSEHELGAPAGAKAAAQAIAVQTAQLEIPSLIRKALSSALAGSGSAASAWAVRSSATAEDRSDASFAGQYASVRGLPNVSGRSNRRVPTGPNWPNTWRKRWLSVAGTRCSIPCCGSNLGSHSLTPLRVSRTAQGRRQRRRPTGCSTAERRHSPNWWMDSTNWPVWRGRSRLWPTWSPTLQPM